MGFGCFFMEAFATMIRSECLAFLAELDIDGVSTLAYNLKMCVNPHPDILGKKEKASTSVETHLLIILRSFDLQQQADKNLMKHFDAKALIRAMRHQHLYFLRADRKAIAKRTVSPTQQAECVQDQPVIHIRSHNPIRPR